MNTRLFLFNNKCNRQLLNKQLLLAYNGQQFSLSSPALALFSHLNSLELDVCRRNSLCRFIVILASLFLKFLPVRKVTTGFSNTSSAWSHDSLLLFDGLAISPGTYLFLPLNREPWPCSKWVAGWCSQTSSITWWRSLITSPLFRVSTDPDFCVSGKLDMLAK